MPLTNPAKQKLLNALLGQDITPPNTIYIGLATQAPLASGLIQGELNESSQGYKRKLVVSYSGTGTNRRMEKNMFNDASASGDVTNKETIYFDEATNAWASPNHIFLTDSLSNPNCFAYAKITDQDGSAITLSIPANSVPLIRAENLRLAFEDKQS